jgi:hypothetical protein
LGFGDVLTFNGRANVVVDPIGKVNFVIVARGNILHQFIVLSLYFSLA